MGKINSGILGAVSGKVAGVVGATWKGRPYLRAYTIPGASNTDLQSAQRVRFAYVVAAAKPFVGRVFNPYYDKFLSKVSGFNRFVTNNIPKAPAFTPIPNFQVTDGPLFPGSNIVGMYVPVTGICTVTWNTALGVDGASTDVAIAWARNRLTNDVVFSADGTRASGTAGLTCACATGLTAADLDCGVFFARMAGTLVSKISRNLSTSGMD